MTISIASSSNPEMEQHIFSRVHSAGRQLARLSAVIEALIQLREADGSFTSNPDLQAAAQVFRQVQRDIHREKKGLRDPEQLISELEQLKSEDPQAFASVSQRLSALV